MGNMRVFDSKATRYLPIEKHTVIGDRRTAALVGANGVIDWLCLPNFDSEAVLGALLDADRGGQWRLGPEEDLLGSQRYIDGTAVVKTHWSVPDWELELTDAMLWPDREDTGPQIDKRIVLRHLYCVRGTAPCLAILDPRRMFGTSYPLISRSCTIPDAPWLGLWASERDIEEALLQSSHASFNLSPGQSVWMMLGLDEPPNAWDVERAQAAMHETISCWSNWTKAHPFFGPRKDAVSRSVLTIRLLSFQPKGSQVAAPTCSLPEKIGGNRNADYRYAWIRDTSLSLAILSIMGDVDSAENFMDWLAGLGSVSEMPLQVAYRIDGGCHLDVREVPGVEGYRGSSPVTVGNHAFDQLQLDSFGYLADCALIYLQHGGQWKQRYWQLIEKVTEFTVANWQRKDSGIWELDEQRHYVSSKVMSWVALDRACRIGKELSLPTPAHWQETMQAIHDEVLQRGWSEKLQAFRQHYDSDDLDASVLLLATMDFLPADDPKMVSTVQAIREQLTRDGLVWRFHPRSLGHSEMPLDGLEGAFLPCTFWLASVLARIGQTDEAQAILDRVDAIFGEVGLFSEEANPATGQALGNMPLVFSHAAHFKAVMDFAKAKPLAYLETMAGLAARKALHTMGLQ
jgi:GH15 family glucan-1,4-alpha-glucosidase